VRSFAALCMALFVGLVIRTSELQDAYRGMKRVPDPRHRLTFDMQKVSNPRNFIDCIYQSWTPS